MDNETPNNPQIGSYEVCWNIFRSNKNHPTIKAYGTNCPCQYNPEQNKNCPMYKPVKIKRT